MVTDRTAADVETALQIRANLGQENRLPTTDEIAALERGTYTSVSLNRVESKQKELAELMRRYLYMVHIINKMDWTYTDIFTYQDHERLLRNLDKLKQAFFVYTDTPNTPTYLYNYSNANDVEKILVDIESMINDMTARFRECNTFYCGEVNNL